MTPAPSAVTLETEGLFSKWGFNDGDEPDEWLDWLEHHGQPIDTPWPLAAIVRTYVLPALDQHVEVYEVETAHNPIRVLSVDGVPATEIWFERDADDPPFLTPETITVPFVNVLALARLKVIPGELVEPLLAIQAGSPAWDSSRPAITVPMQVQ